MTELLLHVNGIQAAFGFEFGSESPRTDEGRAGVEPPVAATKVTIP